MNRINCPKFFLLLKPPESPFNPLILCRVGAYMVNLQLATLLKKRLWHRFFLGILWIFLRTSFLWNTSWKLLLKGEFYENWRTDIFIIKRYQLFQRTDFAREGEVYEGHFIKGNIVLTRNFLYMPVERRQNSWNLLLKRFYF